MMKIGHVGVGLLTLLGLLSLVCAKPLPSEDAFDRCIGVGLSSGCSGCNGPHVDCEWCVDPNDQSWQPSGQYSLCAPEGFCPQLTLPGLGNDRAFVAAPPHLCPRNPLPQGEPLRHGPEISIAAQTKWNGAFDTWYCDFPHQPWVVDRYANPSGNKDPSGNCYEVNNQLAIPQRSKLQNCANVDLSAPRHAECVRLYYSHLCTSSCPEYGVANDFQNLCYDVCERILNTCDEGLLICLEIETPLPFNVADDCEAKDVTQCFSPNLIPVHGRFDRDLCIYGDPAHCSSTDCEVTPIPTLGSYGTQPSPCCFCLDSEVADPNNDGCDGSHAVYAFQVTRPATADGASCEVITTRRLRKQLGKQIDHDHSVICSGNWVGAHCVYEIAFAPAATPAWCSKVADLTGPDACPYALADGLYD